MKVFTRKVVLTVTMMLLAFTVSLGSVPSKVEAMELQNAPFAVEFVGWSNKNWADAYRSAVRNMNDFAVRNSLTCSQSTQPGSWRSIGPGDDNYNPSFAFNGKLTGVCVFSPLP